MYGLALPVTTAVREAAILDMSEFDSAQIAKPVSLSYKAFGVSEVRKDSCQVATAATA
jgi:hypothetical protein